MLYQELLTLNDIKKEPFVIEHILWNLEPKHLMSPKIKKTEEEIKIRDEIKGYVFYIETMHTKPKLFLMLHTAAEFAETAAQIDEIPQEMLLEAIEENEDKHYFGMYPINKKVEEWLKKELGVS